MDTTQVSQTGQQDLHSRVLKGIKDIIRQGTQRGSKSRFIYMNILREIETRSIQLSELEQLKEVKYVGEASYRRIEQLVTMKKEKPKKKRTREYVPTFKSAAYAILLVLHKLKSAHKHLIALKAKEFTETEFNEAQRFSGFSAFKLLQEKGLICKEGRNKYSITSSGELLGEKLIKMQAAEPTEEEDIQLVIDSREKRGNKERTFFQNYFTEQNIKNTTRFLGVGDFLWIKNERIVGFIVERKAGSDLISSVSDGRLREQKARMSSLGLKRYLIIEKMVVEERQRNIVERAVMESMMDGMVVLETESSRESGWVIGELDKRARADNIEEGMSYGSFVEESGRGSSAGTLFLSAVMGVRGVGNRWGAVLQRKFGTLARFQAAAESSKFEEELAGLQADGAKLGMKMARRLIKMLS